jgi:hypothetical protein
VIQHREIKAVRTGHINELLAGRIANTGTLDLDDIRTKPREKLRTGRSRLNMCKVENFDAV